MKIKSYIFLLLAIVCAAFYFCRNSLEYKIQSILNNNCEVGVAVVKGKKQWLVNNDKTYPLMSVFKIFVAAAVLDKAEKENISLDTSIVISKDMIYPTYSPLRDKIKQYPYQSSIEELLVYMISFSDNIATDILISYLGGIKKLNNFVASAGFPQVVIQVNEHQMSTDIQKQKLNRAYPKDVALFMKAIDDGKILSAKQKTVFKQITQQTTTGENKLKAGLPDYVVIGHKTGSSDREEGVKIGDNDAGFVILPNGETYYIVVLIKDSKMTDEQNARQIAQISKLVYDKLQ